LGNEETVKRGGDEKKKKKIWKNLVVGLEYSTTGDLGRIAGSTKTEGGDHAKNGTSWRKARGKKKAGGGLTSLNIQKKSTSVKSEKILRNLGKTIPRAGVSKQSLRTE